MLPVRATLRAGARAASRVSVVAAAALARAAPAAAARRFPVPVALPVRMMSAAANVVTINVPGMGDSISEGTVSQWAKKKDEWLNADDVVVVLETDKVAVDVRTTAAGFLHETLADQGATVKVGAPLFRVRGGDKPAGAPAAAAAPAPAPAAAAPAAAPKAAAPAPAAPAPKAAAPAPAPAPAAAAGAGGAGKPAKEAAAPLKTAAPVVGARTESRVAMSRMRQRIAQRLKDSQNTAAMLTTFQECDMSGMYELRDKYKDTFEKTWGAKLGFMSIFVKAAAATLQELPVINAVIDGGDIVYRDYVDISVAVASPRGLVVPVLRNVEAQSMAQIELGMAELARKARNDSITMEDMAGGTFTISNGGVFGSMMGTPIINPPQSAILGMHSIKPRPVAINGKVEVRPVMYLALTYDHRLIDGREAVTFLASLRDKVEDPRRLLLGV